MTRRRDPYTHLPMAAAGIVLGLALTAVFAYRAYDHGESRPDAQRSPDRATIEGTVEWIGWTRSAARDGPDWFLQLRLKGDRRGFVVAADEVPETHRARLEGRGDERGEIPELVGKEAAVVVDSALLEAEAPYMSGLRVGGEAVLSRDGAGPNSSSDWGHRGLLVGYWIGFLGSVVLLGVSVHHVVVCVRYRSGGAGR